MKAWDDLCERARRIGIELKEEDLEKLKMYLRLLREANRRFNLTAIREESEQIRRLLGESLEFFRFFPREAKRVLDVGTGAGIPGIILQIALPGIRFSLLESSRKKCRFLEGVSQVIHPAFHILAGRAEALAHEAQYREKFDVVVSRAVAPLPVLLELTLPFLRLGGIFAALKSERAEEEISKSRSAAHELGGAEPSLRILAEGLKFIVVEKKKPTPSRFPRRPGIPQKRPLR